MFTNGSYKVLFKRGQFVERLPIVGQSAVSGRGAFLFLALPLHPPSKSMLFLYFCRMRRDRRALTKIGPRPSSVVRTQLEESCGLTRLVKSFVAVPPRRPYVEVMRFTSWSCFDIWTNLCLKCISYPTRLLQPIPHFILNPCSGRRSCWK